MSLIIVSSLVASRTYIAVQAFHTYTNMYHSTVHDVVPRCTKREAITDTGTKRNKRGGWKIKYPEIGYPEFCQLIEQENLDPNKARGPSINVTGAFQFVFLFVV